MVGLGQDQSTNSCLVSFLGYVIARISDPSYIYICPYSSSTWYVKDNCILSSADYKIETESQQIKFEESDLFFKYVVYITKYYVIIIIYIAYARPKP